MTSISVIKTEDTKLVVAVQLDEETGELGEQSESVLLSVLLNTCGRTRLAENAGFDLLLDFDNDGRLIGFETV